MKVVIDIPEARYEELQNEKHLPFRLDLERIITDGIPLDDLIKSFDKECAECYRIALHCVEEHLKEVEA